MDYKTQFQLLFNNTDIIYTGSLYKRQSEELSEFFVINPLKDLSNRSDDNVSTYRNFLIEFDEASLEEQEKALEAIVKAGLPVRTAVHSGSKSYHLIISLADELTVDYKAAWEAIATEVKLVTGITPDSACKNPARLSRIAGHRRKTTGKIQELVYTGNLVKNSKIVELIDKHNISSKTKILSASSLDPDMSKEEFIFRMKHKCQQLEAELVNFKYKVAPAGMHPEILRLTLWAIDSTGVPQSTFIKYAEEKMLPYLIGVGYPAAKMYRSITAAYEYKGDNNLRHLNKSYT